MSDSIKLTGVTLDCPEPAKLAAFYAEITGGQITYTSEGWATVKSVGGMIEFQRAPGYIPPRWPDPASPMQVHLDFYVDDLDETEARVVAAGAMKFGEQPNDHCRVFADPAGHPFCLSLQAEAGQLDL